MTDLLPLRDRRSQASPELRALLSAAEPPSPLPAATRERVRRALANRAATSERRAVCWSHAFGCALALACLAGLLPQRPPRPEQPVARAPVASAPFAPPIAATVSEPAPSEPALAEPVRAEAAHVVPPAATEHVIARRASPRRRLTTTPARSRRRIEALVDDILKPEAQLLDRARREVERDPEQALALIDTFRRDHPESSLPAPTAVAEIDALRRLGRFEEALAKARALLESSRKPYYADEMAERFALLDL